MPLSSRIDGYRASTLGMPGRGRRCGADRIGACSSHVPPRCRPPGRAVATCCAPSGRSGGTPCASWPTCRRQYGDVLQFPIPQPPTYLVTDPDAVRRVLVTNAKAYGKRTLQYSTLSLVTGEGLLTADTEPWRPQRRLVQPAFHHGTLELVAEHVATATDRLVASWSQRDGAIVDVDEAMMHLALEVVGRTLFGSDLSGDAAAARRRDSGCTRHRRQEGAHAVRDAACACRRRPIWPCDVLCASSTTLWRGCSPTDPRRPLADGHAAARHARPAPARARRRRLDAHPPAGARPGDHLHRRRARDGGQRAHLGVAPARRRPPTSPPGSAPRSTPSARPGRRSSRRWRSCPTPPPCSTRCCACIRPPGW